MDLAAAVDFIDPAQSGGFPEAISTAEGSVIVEMSEQSVIFLLGVQSSGFQFPSLLRMCGFF